MSNVDINVDRRTDWRTDGLTDGRTHGCTDGQKIGRLYRTLLQAGAITNHCNCYTNTCHCNCYTNTNHCNCYTNTLHLLFEPEHSFSYKISCMPRELSQACISVQADHSLHCPSEDTLDCWLLTQCPAETMIRLPRCTDWSESLLSIYGILCPSSYHITAASKSNNSYCFSYF